MTYDVFEPQQTQKTRVRFCCENSERDRLTKHFGGCLGTAYVCQVGCKKIPAGKNTVPGAVLDARATSPSTPLLDANRRPMRLPYSPTQDAA